MLKKKIKDEDAFQTPLIGLHLRYPQREENERERERERERRWYTGMKYKEILPDFREHNRTHYLKFPIT